MAAPNRNYAKILDMLRRGATVEEIARTVYPYGGEHVGMKRKRRVYAAIAYLRRKGYRVTCVKGASLFGIKDDKEAEGSFG